MSEYTITIKDNDEGGLDVSSEVKSGRNFNEIIASFEKDSSGSELTYAEAEVLQILVDFKNKKDGNENES